MLVWELGGILWFTSCHCCKVQEEVQLAFYKEQEWLNGQWESNSWPSRILRKLIFWEIWLENASSFLSFYPSYYFTYHFIIFFISSKLYHQLMWIIQKPSALCDMPTEPRTSLTNPLSMRLVTTCMQCFQQYNMQYPTNYLYFLGIHTSLW